MRTFLKISAILGFIAVALGAFGAHGLEGVVSESGLENWDKAVLYQMFHTLTIAVIALLIAHYPQIKNFVRSGWFFLLGVILFSGSLYTYTLTGVTAFALITPFGGVSFLIGWVLLFIGVFRISHER